MATAGPPPRPAPRRWPERALAFAGVYTDVLLRATGFLRPVYEGVDWSATALGPIESWSPALRGALDVALQSRFPVGLYWGRDLVLLYNEAFVSLIADKHPAALGRPGREIFPEAWPVVGPMLAQALAGEGATWVEDASVPLKRHGRMQEAYFTFSYSPVRGADGTIEGVLNIATETTRQVIDRRRLETVSRLHETLGDPDDAEAARTRALSVLRTNPDDLPGAEILLPGPTGPRRSVAGDDELGTVIETRSGPLVRFFLGSAQDVAQRPVLEVHPSESVARDEDYLGFLRLIASAVGEAIDRVAARDSERDVAAAERSISEALQRSLLTQPMQPDHLQVAVRYRPAAAQAQVGGDWHDAFLSPDGSLTLVVGDVTGHDVRAVAAMAQSRNLLRGVSYAMAGSSPAQVLCCLDQAMDGLAIGVYATAILARVEQDEADAARGLRTLRWSNAGHPPPVLLGPDGRARLLEAPPDALLGMGDGERTDHVVTLEPDTSVVFYTDGLIERRTTPLQERLEWLTGALEGRAGLDAEELCDHLLAQLDEPIEDDVALLVLRAYSANARPPAP